MVGAMVLGAWLMRPSADTVLVWRASADLPVGAVPVAEPVAVSLGSAAAAYPRASTPLTGRMRIAVPAGALIPAGAIGAAAPDDRRQVTLPVDPQHAPIDLVAGAIVDVWATPANDSTTPGAPPRLVLPQALVSAVSSQPSGMSGALSVVIEAPADAASTLIAASRTGVVDLVLVPLVHS